MKNLVLIICAVTAAYFNVSSLRADNPFDTTASPTPSPASVNVYDWYALGELLGAAREFNYNLTVADQMDAAYKRIYDAMQKTHLSDSTIAAFKEWYPQLKKLPWNKDWQTWTKEEQDTWLHSPACANWFTAVSQDAKRSVATVFFYWLGRQTISAAWVVPYYESQGWKKDAIEALKNVATDCYAFSTDSTYSSIFQALAPDVQRAITVMGEASNKLKPKADDPFASGGGGGGGGALSDDEIANIVAAAKQVRAAAQGHKLIKE
jgi:hypothetical protein